MPQPFTRLPFPAGGVVKRLAFQDQEPFSTQAAFNVRPDEMILGRERGGSRPGLGKAFAQQLGSGNKVRLISDVSYVVSSASAIRRVASANGVLYRDVAGTLTAVSSAITLASDRQLSAAYLLNKLYICGDNSANRALSVYDPSANTLALVVATTGSLPTKCKLAAAWRGRLVLAGDGDSPQNWYMSKQGVPTAWDYAEDDVSAAVAGNNSDTFQVGEPVKALVPHSKECLVFGCLRSLWILRGDPLQGGRLDQLSHRVGILDSHAWAYDDAGFLFFMTHDGLYVMPPGCGATPSSVSREKLPQEMLNIDTSVTTVSLAYDFTHRGLHIFVSGASAATTSHWWVSTKGTKKSQAYGGGSSMANFWPVGVTSNHDPFCAYSRRDSESSAGQSEVLLGGRDGYVRRFDASLAQDDGSLDINAYVDYGPFPLGPDGYEGLLTELEVTTAEDSGPVDIEVKVGKTPERATAADVFSTHRCDTAGLNATHRPRARGSACVLRVRSGGSNAAWGIDEILSKAEPTGLRRV